MVVVIDGIKYAWYIIIRSEQCLCRNALLTPLFNTSQVCIKGHRVAQCQHTHRPLLPLQRKGRPVSQCNHCRGNRVKNKSHVKCTCAISSGNLHVLQHRLVATRLLSYPLLVPNPINGCMCHVIDLCTCVPLDLQDTRNATTSESIADSNMAIAASVQLADVPTLADNELPPVVDQDVWNAVMGDIDSICSHSPT